MNPSAPIVFVVRASVQDGLGHLVRSLCVLRELLPLTKVHLLLLGDGAGLHLAQDSGIPFTRCNSDGNAAEVTAGLLPMLVVFDTLHLEPEALDRILVMGVATASLSPVFSGLPRVQHLFHRSAVENPAWRAEPNFPRLHKGLEFAILPACLRRIPSELYRQHLEEDRLAMAISMGGTDSPNRTLDLLRLLGLKEARLVIFVALGEAYRHSYEKLLDCAAESRQEIILLKSNESMWRVLRNASLVVCAGGLTTYEAAFIGIPSINILQQAEWSYLFEELETAGACIALPPDSESLSHAASLVLELEKNRTALAKMHSATKGLIPGNGATRVARKLVDIALNPRVA